VDHKLKKKKGKSMGRTSPHHHPPISADTDGMLTGLLDSAAETGREPLDDHPLEIGNDWCRID
jgi:hypothetical protein